MHDYLPPFLREWVVRQAEAMGLASPDEYIILLLRLERQNQALRDIEERYRAVFISARQLDGVAAPR